MHFKLGDSEVVMKLDRVFYIEVVYIHALPVIWPAAFLLLRNVFMNAHVLTVIA